MLEEEPTKPWKVIPIVFGVGIFIFIFISVISRALYDKREWHGATKIWCENHSIKEMNLEETKVCLKYMP